MTASGTETKTDGDAIYQSIRLLMAFMKIKSMTARNEVIALAVQYAEAEAKTRRQKEDC
ncbi:MULTISPECIES: hypothetical protein [Bradyrhizobium]|uniref:hypothetical protein n=1 Tax=Bradyrhizobium TaxID=374 RepID=UPI0004AD04B4|nr:hypothetical protein [Bradyrhizobium elkanii]MBP2433941.1 hypothetical protein [Bradyrhizobium elkanii]MBR1159990.1 hypothetical protein [Bradyrhizobium elkanii]WLA85714.1 hypothetical protein QNJ99_16690 [Bradyrhizobium elkanii]WLA89091.1 hypothetical protein QNJ96_28980 [Bradyrhizobium elkanii]